MHKNTTYHSSNSLNKSAKLWQRFPTLPTVERTYILKHLHDYFPYGKTLREWYATNEDTERFQTTHHQRDTETTLDYRGARFYDADVGRFLSLDPLAADYPSWSDYNYVLGNPVSLVDPDGMDVHFVTYTGGSQDSYEAAVTRKNEIENSENFDPENDHVYFVEVSDLGKLKEAIHASLKDADCHGYGKTVEFSVFGHGGVDGPVGAEEASEGSLANITGNRGVTGDQKQVSPSYWKSINFNFDSKNSFACFYGCNTLQFAESFMTYQSDVKYASGLDGGAGGSYNEEGKFNKTIFNIFNRPVYMVTTVSGKIDDKSVYSRDRENIIDSYNDVEGNNIPMRKPSFQIRGNLSIEKINK